MFGDYHPNPHIKALPSEPIAEQLDKLGTARLEHACAYPASKHLKEVLDPSKFSDRPFELCLALGEPQLSHKSFDLDVLEIYRNDPRDYYQYDDIHGYISIKDEFFQTDKMKVSDQILLESFGFSLDEDGNIYVAVFLRYLAKLSPEHQLIWTSKQVESEAHLHPDYFRTSIIGDWPERLSLYQSVLLEMKTANEISEIIGRKPIFKKDFSQDKRPREFGYLLRPTLKEYNEFVHLLDKMLSENINREFFGTDVSFETEEPRRDGKIVVRQKGTIKILEDWLRSKFKTDDWSEIEEMLQTFRHVRSLRQKPAHSIKENEFDQKYVHEQRELMKSLYRAVKILRVVLGLHPHASGVSVNRHLQEGLIWSI
ncbi:MAG: AAA family ATPase [Thermodesulfobacteriota bacterium]|nr:AAA family ATPase [Thermodesulfobacteriota bacterium]